MFQWFQRVFSVFIYNIEKYFKKGNEITFKLFPEMSLQESLYRLFWSTKGIAMADEIEFNNKYKRSKILSFDDGNWKIFI